MSFELQREQLVENELRILGIRDEGVLRAMRIVPREAFVSEEMREFAYRNAPLPIGSGQTISQPLIVAHMAEALELSPHERVLEIGTGSGYAAAGKLHSHADAPSSATPPWCSCCRSNNAYN